METYFRSHSHTENLAAIEDKMGEMIPIKHLFDLIGVTSAGVFAAIGTGIKDMKIKDLIPVFHKKGNI